MTTYLKAALFGAVLGTAALPAMAQTAATMESVASAVAKTVAQTSYAYVTSTTGADVTQLSNGTIGITTDCSGWVSYNLRGFTTAYQDVQAYQPQVSGEAGKPFPRADVYRQYFANLPAGAPFTQIQKLSDIQPGDILAWCLPGYCDNGYTGTPATDTGHVMVVMSTPITNDANSAFLMVLDSSTVTHYSFETLPAAVQTANPGLAAAFSQYPDVRVQTQSDGKVTTSGVGPGFILFGTNSDGTIASFQFGPGDGVHSANILFAVGRLNPNVAYTTPQ